MTVRHVGEHHGHAIHPTIGRLPGAILPLRVPPAVVAEACGGEQWGPLNPSIYFDTAGVLWCIVRLYRLRNGVHRTANIIGRIDESWQLVDARVMRHRDGRVCTYEDIRLCTVGKSLGGVATTTVSQMAVLTLDDAGVVQAATPIPSPGRMEKNWSPVLGHEGPLRLVYSVDPLAVLTYSSITRTCSPVPSAKLSATVRGGSQFVPFGWDRWLGVVHEVIRRPDGWPLYVHRFVTLDADLTHAVLGRPWILRTPGIEFVAGLARVRDRWALSWGSNDREACLALVEDEVVRAYVVPTSGPLVADVPRVRPVHPAIPAVQRKRGYLR